MISRELDMVDVDADLSGQVRRMGSLRRQRTRSGDIFSFAYSPEWLRGPSAFSFDPDLAMSQGPQYPAPGRASFGIFMDSSPDRWGRVLMQRRENLRARREGRRPGALTEWDFLLGVHDKTRMGALRFAPPGGGPYIESSDDELAAPPLTSLRELQAASLDFERHADDEDHPDYGRWLRQLFAPGTSLGGARPKACVRDEEGSLCLAKFPSRQDTRDTGAWELVAHRLAAKAGINVPVARGLRVAESAGTTFVAKRFDRTPEGGRIAFVSAMTLTQRMDGDGGASYLELVDLLQSRGTDTHRDCLELYRRVVFSILIHNTDDHLRNHGFFIDSGEGPRTGISLSPAYDINPSLDGRGLSLAINEVENACDLSLALDARALYGVSAPEADTIIGRSRAAVASWRDEARRLGIPKGEQDLMAGAFEA